MCLKRSNQTYNSRFFWFGSESAGVQGASEGLSRADKRVYRRRSKRFIFVWARGGAQEGRRRETARTRKSTRHSESPWAARGHAGLIFLFYICTNSTKTTLFIIVFIYSYWFLKIWLFLWIFILLKFFITHRTYVRIYLQCYLCVLIKNYIKLNKTKTKNKQLS